MKSIKKMVTLVLVSIIAISSLSILASAAYNEWSSYIYSDSSFLGNTRLFSHANIGFKYKDSSCNATNAQIKSSLRIYNSQYSIFYSTKGSATGPANIGNVYTGYKFLNANTEGTYVYGAYKIDLLNNKIDGVKQIVDTDTYIVYDCDY